MRLKLIQFIILATSLFIIGCSEPYNPISEETDNQTVILAELEVGQLAQLTVSSTYRGEELPLIPNDSDGEVSLSNHVSGQLDNGLRFVNRESTQVWISQSFQFKEGHDISISADFSAIGMGSVYAECTVPVSGKINTSQANRTDNTTQVSLSVDLAKLPTGAYYHLTPYLAHDLGRENLNIEDIDVGEEQTYLLSHTDGMLIDMNSNGNGTTFELLLSTKTLDLSSFSTINLELRTVTEDYYKYHRFLTVYSETQQGPFNAPIPTYTNIEGGQGIFVAFASQTETADIQ